MVRSKDRKNKPTNIHIRDDNRGSSIHLKPKFSLEFLDREFCISCCDKNEKAAFADKMRLLSQLTWAEINCAPRHGLGFEKIAQNSINFSIPKRITPDTNIIAFRFCGTAAMVGFKENEVFYIIWFDRNYKLYDHG